MQTDIANKGEEVYRKLRRELEESHMGKVVAIDIEKEEMVGMGDDVNEAYRVASKKYPDRPFYFRKVGKEPQTGYQLVM
jgi:hypothetical protein